MAANVNLDEIKSNMAEVTAKIESKVSLEEFGQAMDDKVSKSELSQRLQDKVSFKDMMHFLKLDDEADSDAENNIQSVITASSQ